MRTAQAGPLLRPTPRSRLNVQSRQGAWEAMVTPHQPAEQTIQPTAENADNGKNADDGKNDRRCFDHDCCAMLTTIGTVLNWFGLW